MYYPNVMAYATETRFGAREIIPAGVYNKPIKNKVIIKVDLLECLRELIGNSCFINRELLYSVVSGSDRRFNSRKALASMYRRCRGMTRYVNDAYFYDDVDEDFVTGVVRPLRDTLTEYTAKVRGIMLDHGFRPLLVEEDFIYFAAPSGTTIPKIEGIEVIC